MRGSLLPKRPRRGKGEVAVGSVARKTVRRWTSSTQAKSHAGGLSAGGFRMTLLYDCSNVAGVGCDFSSQN